MVAAAAWHGVHAHAVLLDSTPAAEAVLAQAPERLVLRFNEPVSPVLVRLLAAPDAASIDLEPPETVDTELRIVPAAELPDGSYVLSYRVTSADGHPVAGSLIFAIGTPGRGVELPAAAAVHDGLWSAAGVVAGALHYGCLLLAAGLALFVALLPVPESLRARLRRTIVWLAAAGLAACMLRLGATAGALYGGPPDALLTSPPWRVALASPVARSILVAALGLGVLVAAPRQAFRRPRPVLLAGACLVAVSFALSGHAATAGPGWITVPALTVHALSAAYWVGAFAPLLLALRRLPRAEAHALLAAFSTRAVVAVACLLLAGLVLSALQLRTPPALIATDYGRLLLLKLALVALLLGLGAINRWVLTPALARRIDAVSRLRRTIGVDLVLAAGVVVLTAGLGTVPPPRALAEQAEAHARTGDGSRDYAVAVAAHGHQLVLVATPAAAGQNRIDLYLTDAQGRPVDAQAAELSWELPDLGIEAIDVVATAIEPGRFQARANLPLAGQWQVQADLLIDDFTKLPFRARIVVGR